MADSGKDTSKSTAKGAKPVDILFRAPLAKPSPVLEPIAPAPEVEAKATPLPSLPVVKPERKPERKPIKAKPVARVVAADFDDDLGDDSKSFKRRIRQSRSAPLRSIRIEEDVYESIRTEVESLAESLGSRVTFQDVTTTLLMMMVRDARLRQRVKSLLREGRV
jgi:hypothetical protein